jgi:hypothetical protein
MSNFVQKLWTVLNHQNSFTNLTSVFSYEIIANFYFEMCSLYSHLFYNPQSLVVNSAKQMKILLDMIETFCFTSHANNSTTSTDESQSIVVKLKFLNNLLDDQNLYDVCNKNMTNFELKFVSFIVYVYLNNSSRETMEQNNSKNVSQVDKELQNFVRLSSDKLKIFSELKISFNSNLEEFLTSFVAKFAFRLKNLQVVFKFNDIGSKYELIFVFLRILMSAKLSWTT